MSRDTLASKQQEIFSLEGALMAKDQEISNLRTEHKKALESFCCSIKYNADRASEAQNELEQLHGLLDALPCCLPRKSIPAGYEEWQARPNTAMTRLASWLALR